MQSASFPEWQHKVVLRKRYRGQEYGRDATITVTAGLHYLQGNERPYFSVTAEIRRPRRSDCEACGCLHDDVLRHWPQLAPVVALHLSDDTGAPMHAGANGTYHLGFGRYGTLNPEHAANHWRIDASEVMPLRKRLTDGANVFHDRDRNGKVIVRPALNKAELGRVLDEMRPRWRAEAEAAIAVLDHLAEGA